MKIHSVVEHDEYRYEMDPKTGNRARVRESVLADSGTDCLLVDGVTYHADESGTFDVPDDIAKRFVGKTIGGAKWYEGFSPFAFEAKGPEIAKAAPRTRPAR